MMDTRLRASAPLFAALLLVLAGCEEEDPPTCPLESPFTGRYLSATTEGDSLELAFLATATFPTIGEGGVRSVTLNVTTNQTLALVYEEDCANREGRLECARLDRDALAELVPGQRLEDSNATLVARIEDRTRVVLQAERSGGRMRFIREGEASDPLEIELAIRVDFRSPPECIDLIDAALFDPLPPMPVCGDGRLDRDEVCDDGNRVGGDGCDSICAIEDASCGIAPASWDVWRCSGEPSTCTRTTCETLEPDPLCIEGASITGEARFTGRLEQTDPRPAFEDSTGLWRCSCTEDGLGRRCDDACETRLGLCHELPPPQLAGLDFGGWSGESCAGFQRCVLGPGEALGVSARFASPASEGLLRYTLTPSVAERLTVIDALPAPEGGFLFLARAEADITVGAQSWSPTTDGYSYLGLLNADGLLTAFDALGAAQADLFPLALTADATHAYVLSRVRSTATIGALTLTGDSLEDVVLTRIPWDDLAARESITLPGLEDGEEILRARLAIADDGALYTAHTSSRGGALTALDATLDPLWGVPVEAIIEDLALTPEGDLQITGNRRSDGPEGGDIPAPQEGFITAFTARYRPGETDAERLWLRTFQEARGDRVTGLHALTVDRRGHTWVLWQSPDWRGLLDLNTDGSTAASQTEPADTTCSPELGAIALDADDNVLLAQHRCANDTETALVVSRHSPEGALLTTERWLFTADPEAPLPRLASLRFDGDALLIIGDAPSPDADPALLLSLPGW